MFQQFAWHVTPRSHAHDGRRFLDVALASSASQVFRLDHVTTVRVGRAIVPVFKQHCPEEVAAWLSMTLCKIRFAAKM